MPESFPQGWAPDSCPHLVHYGGDSLSRAHVAEHSPIELRTTADTVLRRRLLSVPGVSQVTPIGGGEKQYQVLLSGKLQTYGVSLHQVTEALAASNDNVSAGFLVVSGAEYLVTGRGHILHNGRHRRDGGGRSRRRAHSRADLGSVRIDTAPKRGEGSVNATPAVILGIQKQPGANTLTLLRGRWTRSSVTSRRHS